MPHYFYIHLSCLLRFRIFFLTWCHVFFWVMFMSIDSVSLCIYVLKLICLNFTIKCHSNFWHQLLSYIRDIFDLCRTFINLWWICNIIILISSYTLKFICFMVLTSYNTMPTHITLNNDLSSVFFVPYIRSSWTITL